MNTPLQTPAPAPAMLSRLAYDAGSIERWLIERVAALSQECEDDIDVSRPFSHYAMDSIATATLTAEIEDWLDVKLPATLIWDYPSIEALTGHLSRLHS